MSGQHSAATKLVFGDPNFTIIPAPTLLNPLSLDEEGNNNVRVREQNLTNSMTKVRDLMKNLQNATPRDRDLYSRLFTSAKLRIIDAANILQIIMREQRGALTEIQFCEYYSWIEISQILAVYNYAFLEEETPLKEAINRINDYMFSTDANETIEKLIKMSNSEDDNDTLEQLKFQSSVTFRDFSGRQELIGKLQNDLLLAGLRTKFTFYLFTGPPGTGKSEIAQAIMTYLPNTESYLLNMPELSGQYVGQTENTLKRLFNRISNPELNNRRFVIFLDEVDEVFSKDLPATSYLNTVATTLQTLLAGSMKIGNNVTFIAATNYKSMIRPTILDRVTKVFFVDTPSKSDVLLYFRHKCNITDDPKDTEYYENHIVPFVKSMPLQITYRNLNNIMSGAIDIALQYDKDYFFKMTANDSVIATQQLQPESFTDINHLKNITEIREFVKKSTIPIFGVNRQLLLLITASNGQIYYRPSVTELITSSKDVIMMSFDKYLQFLILNEQTTRNIDGVDVPIADLTSKIKMFEWQM
ncbi:putative ATPase [Dolichomitus sp. PSUC_FEM 10030005]|nr:putative ATPase [Dolichomitus sp. PSUC_FEM 10030005]